MADNFTREMMSLRGQMKEEFRSVMLAIDAQKAAFERIDQRIDTLHSLVLAEHLSTTSRMNAIEARVDLDVLERKAE